MTGPSVTGRVGLTDSFVSTFGRQPEGVWAAPGRGNLIGEFTDYNGGSVLPFALDRTTLVAAGRRPDMDIVVSSGDAPGPQAGPRTVAIDDLGPGGGSGWSDYVLGVVWAMLAAGHAIGGVEIRVESNVPIGAGLSSSAALECAVALALDDLHATGLPRMELARIAQRAENDYVGVPCGIMDQAASLCCTVGHVLLLDTATLQHRQVAFAPADAGLQMLLVDTRVKHDLADSAYAERRRTCERAAADLGVATLCDVASDELDGALRRLPDVVTRRRVRHVVTENARVLASVGRLDAGDPRGVGDLLTAAHRSLRDDFEVSCVELDTAVDAALAAGACGARMIGGGFGGCVLALVEHGAANHTGAAVTEAFAAAGLASPTVFATEPSAGATRLL